MEYKVFTFMSPNFLLFCCRFEIYVLSTNDVDDDNDAHAYMLKL